MSEIEARCALIQLTPPTVNTAELDVEISEFQYELSLSDKHDGSYTVMYRFVRRLCWLWCDVINAVFVIVEAVFLKQIQAWFNGSDILVNIISMCIAVN